MSELPKGWVLTQLGNYIQVKNGYAFKSSDYITPDQNSVPVIRISDIQNGIASTQNASYISKEFAFDNFKVSKGDLLIAMSGATTGKTGVFNEDCEAYQNQRVGNIKFLSENFGCSGYRNYLVEFLTDEILKKAYGAAQPNISGNAIEELIVPIAPLNEQIRIADKLDSILAKVNKAQERLEKIPGILKRFRQSVFAAATSGELTREWRGNDAIVTTGIPGLSIPVEWRFCTVEDIGVVKGGKRLPKGDELTENNTGFPYIRAGQLKNGTVVQGDSARNKQMFLEPKTQAQIKRYTVNEGDVYLTIVGASIGDAGVIPHALHRANLTENAAKITNFDERINAEYLSIWLRSERLQELIQLEIKSGAQGKLALKRINTLPVPLPSIDEQHEIVSIVAALLSHAEALDKCYQNVKLRVDRLTQSILAKAFRGELVEQNPEDEPADKLLERIKKQQLEGPKATRQTRKPAAKVTPSVDAVENDVELARPESEIFALLKKTSGELSAQQIMEQLTDKTFRQVDTLFTELKHLLETKAITKVGIGEACMFKAVKR
ncbi:restriction endonuclease subunit S [Rheinheimera sp. MM224]|uniref:restriction endonuclease subunit S n=1 Tax=Rheinheimera sp. MM224 TaxID=3019969 RepID=UPI0021F91448|nr:restriction endonuclease subunit S [Rheinheimera sp. MM224]CAI3791987.1 Type-1 restriction enzyme EcoKI specificity protein [Rheinheimera sp. MM224]